MSACPVRGSPLTCSKPENGRIRNHPNKSTFSRAAQWLRVRATTRLDAIRDIQLRLYLIRHGHARSDGNDAQRPLTEQGRREVTQAASWVEHQGGTIREIRHSGILRARQSAEILALQLRPERGILRVPGLQPFDDVWAAAAGLAVTDDTLMIVGHLPFLGRLSSLLVTGDPEHGVTQFATGSAALLERAHERWRLIERFSPA